MDGASGGADKEEQVGVDCGGGEKFDIIAVAGCFLSKAVFSEIRKVWTMTSALILAGRLISLACLLMSM